MKLTLKLTDEVRRYDGVMSRGETTHTEVIIDVTEQTFSRSLMGAFFRALADEIDPHVREAVS